jgi:hypothetical protein
MDSYSNDLSNYIVYKTSLPADPERFNCDFEKVNIQTPPTAEPIKLKAAIVKDGLLRKYRLALSSTVEYSNYHINRAGFRRNNRSEKSSCTWR